MIGMSKPVDACRYDILSLGEVMVRLDPGVGRIHTSRHFSAWEGGGEYNVARGLKQTARQQERSCNLQKKIVLRVRPRAGCGV